MLQRLKAGILITTILPPPYNFRTYCRHPDIELHPAAKAITTLKEIVRTGTFVFVAPSSNVLSQLRNLSNCLRLEKPNSDAIPLDQLEELRSKLVLGVAVEEAEIEHLIDYFQSLLLYLSFFYFYYLLKHKALFDLKEMSNLSLLH